MLRLLLAAALLFAVGCASDPDEGGTDGGGLAGDVEVQSNESADAVAPEQTTAIDTTGPARVEVAGRSVPTRGVLTDMQSGDVSCYLTILADDGTTETVNADYSVCDSNALIDRRVQVEYVQGDVLADSCEGDPECLDTETVALAVVADAID